MNAPTDVATLLPSAERALSAALGRVVRLGEAVTLTEPGRRNVVLRCRDLAGGEPASIVIKQVVTEKYDPHDTSSWDVRRFLTDWIGAEFLTAVPGHFAPRFLAGDRAAGFFVLEDLGPHRSLAEQFLEGDAASATEALLSFARCLGRLHAATHDESARFARLCGEARISLTPAPELDGRLERLQVGLGRLELAVPTTLRRELETIRETIARPGPFLAYIHGDPCPDNLFLSGDRVHLIDFEFGRFGHALIDGAYGRMMFPTCWCANRLPDAVLARFEAAYRDELVRGCPEAHDDRVFATALGHTCAFWLVNTVGWHLNGALDDDRTWGIATVRSRLIARLETFLALSGDHARLPATRDMAERLLVTLRSRWPETPTLPLYPAFRAAS